MLNSEVQEKHSNNKKSEFERYRLGNACSQHLEHILPSQQSKRKKEKKKSEEKE